MYMACVFDMDGTLVNTLDSIASFGNTALKSIGYQEIETEVYRKLVGNGADKLMERMFEHIGKTPTDDEKRKLREEYDKLYESNPLDKVKVYDGIYELLHRLKSDGFKLAVLSNKPENMTKFIADNVFEGYFDIVIGQQDDTPMKPDPTVLNSIIKSFGFEKNEILYIGDSDADMQTAKNAGVDSCGVLWGFRDKEELISSGATFTAKDTKELFEVAVDPD